MLVSVTKDFKPLVRHALTLLLVPLLSSRLAARAGSVKRPTNNHVPHPIICEISKRKESAASCRITDIATPRLECGDGMSEVFGFATAWNAFKVLADQDS
uniref:Secreted protein n=1 Tax=Steinernema glaseri TaxID=37863 RepID=A0A1I7XZP0_9BILA